MTNWYVVTGLALRLISVVGLLAYVVPLQVKEIRRPRRDKYVVLIRWVLFTMVFVYVVQSVIPIAYQTSRVHTASVFNWQNISTVSSNFGNLALSSGFALLYKLADILAKTRKG